eukprot:8452575-Karenia_brevis.AAC.1
MSSSHESMQPQNSRSIFPLPFVPVADGRNFVSDKKCSRSVIRRQNRKCETLQWVNQGIAALNDLAGFRHQKRVVES